LDITPEQYNIASLINDSAHMNMMRIGDKPIEFELQINENTPAKLIGDKLRIKQILSNILSNAFKYTDAGKVILSVDPEPTDDGVIIVFRVSDTGCGMTKEQVGELFDAYSRFCNDTETGRAIEGAGLGLSITQRLVNLMDGDIDVESVPGKGSSFFVRLPQKMVDSCVLGKKLTEDLAKFRSNYLTRNTRAKIEREKMPYGSVLIVDDMETNIYVAVRLMKSYGLKIDTAMSGHIAIEKVKSGKAYDVIFMDHMMPGLDGIEATKRLRESGYTSPDVALTANAVTGQADMFLKKGFDAFVSKPIDIRELDSVLNKFVRDKQPPEVLEAHRKKNENVNKKEVAKEADKPEEINSMLLESVINDAKKCLVTIEHLIQSTEILTDSGLQAYIIAVHGIKGSLGNIGENRLSKYAYKLEFAGREKDFDLVMSATPEFVHELRCYINELESKQSSADGIGMSELRNNLLAIEKRCSDGDKNGALTILTDMKDSVGESQSLLDNIERHLSSDELADAANVAMEYSNILSVVLDD
jgi:CheY-like chemotaxis protein/anti-sigma regulatory factor (Ser/Thr protein kinase)